MILLKFIKDLMHYLLSIYMFTLNNEYHQRHTFHLKNTILHHNEIHNA